MNSTVQIIRDAAKMGRKMRSPRHPFYLETQPWQIQPMLCAPVLPGETMSNLMLQSRVATDPVRNKLVGWHKEYYFFYVKLRDLDIRDQLLPMFIDPAHSNAPLRAPNSVSSDLPKFMQAAGNIPFVKLCLDRVVDEYFRNEGEGVDEFMVHGLPCANLNITDASQSAVLTSDVEAAPHMPGEQVENPNEIDGFDQAYLVWEHMRATNLTQLTYEDYLKSNGIRGKAVEQIVDDHKPELLRYIRDWQYPSNTIDSATGAATSAVVWSIMERADKDRMFKEPGFIFGVTVTRPKVYVRSLRQGTVGWLQTAFDWLPGTLREQAQTSLRKFANAWDGGPYGALADGEYWIDVRDLFLHGEQFVNVPLMDLATPLDTGIPTAWEEPGNFQSRYPVNGDADRLFVNPQSKIREDGVVSLNIKGTVMEETP